MSISRRNFLNLSTGLTVGAFSGVAGLSLSKPAFAQASQEELLTAGPLGEKAIGDPDAPVTMIEYASLTCGHCATFHNTIFPEFKEKYVETGKVYFILREFPLDPLAVGAVMLARCAGEDKFFNFVDVLFQNQQTWTRTNEPVAALFNLAKQGGFTRESFDKCLSNQQLFEGVRWVKTRAEKNFEVRSTPTFFIDGEVYRGVLSMTRLDEILTPLLNG